MTARAPRLLVAAVLVAALLPGGAPAHATEFCMVRESGDGFVALRSGPGARFPLVAKMKADDEVRDMAEQKGSWVRVRHWRGTERLEPATAEKCRDGWMHRRFMGECG